MRYKGDNEKGRSMVEMMGYMAVVMALVVSVGNLVAQTMEEYKYSKAYTQLTDLATGIVRAAVVDEDYNDVVDGISDGISQYTKIIPASFRKKGNTIYHAFGGTVDISVPEDIDFNWGYSHGETARSDKFAITFNGLNRKQCIEMALKDWENNKNIDLYAIIINSNNYWYWPAYTTFTEVEGVVADNTLPVTRAAVAGTDINDKGQCDRDTNNVIMWIFN